MNEVIITVANLANKLVDSYLASLNHVLTDEQHTANCDAWKRLFPEEFYYAAAGKASEKVGLADEDAKTAKNVKKKYPDAIIIMHDGDNYTIYGDDAKEIEHVIARPILFYGHKSKGIRFFHTELDGYLPKLIKAGFRVAICDTLHTSKK